MSTSLDRENKEAYLLVEFKYGDPDTFVRFCTADGGMYYEDNLYSGNPAMKVKLPENTGSLNIDESDKASVEVYLEDDELFKNASNTLPHAPIEARIIQILLSKDEDPYESILFKGEVQSSVRNRAGRAKRVTFYLRPERVDIDIPSGMVCVSDCNWIFGGRGCERAREFLNRTVIDIQGSVITLNSDLVTEGEEYRYTLGSASFEGLSLSIRDLKGSTVTLRQQPPETWLNSSIQFGTGCDKSLETCRLWNNEERFSGLGVAMIDYNPLYEDPEL